MNIRWIWLNASQLREEEFAFMHMLECDFASLVFKKNNLRTTLCFYSLFGNYTSQHKKILKRSSKAYCRGLESIWFGLKQVWLAK